MICNFIDFYFVGSPEVLLVHQYGPSSGIIEALQQGHNGALSTARLPYEGNLLALHIKKKHAKDMAIHSSTLPSANFFVFTNDIAKAGRLLLV